jgi:hypothetical protein
MYIYINTVSPRRPCACTRQTTRADVRGEGTEAGDSGEGRRRRRRVCPRDDPLLGRVLPCASDAALRVCLPAQARCQRSARSARCTLCASIMRMISCICLHVYLCLDVLYVTCWYYRHVHMVISQVIFAHLHTIYIYICIYIDLAVHCKTTL